MNVALVVLDTLRKDTFDEYFDWLPGTSYDNAWSTSHWTIPAHTALFTGQYASEVGTYARSMQLDWNDDVLAERLSANGYTTRAFSANIGISPSFDFDRGFDSFEKSHRLELAAKNLYDWREFVLKTRSEEAGPQRFLRGLKDTLVGDFDTFASLKRGVELKLDDLGFDVGPPDDGAQNALEMIQKTNFGDDEFLFLNLMEAHGPYDPPKKYRTFDDYEMPDHPLGIDEDGDSDPDPVRRAYDDSVRYLSDVYSEMFDLLREDFDYVVTLSDHGNCFGEHDIYGHTYGLYPELTHVPLCVYDGTEERETDDTMVSLLDVHQTILEVTDVEGPSRGQSLVSDPSSAEVLTEYHGITLAEKIDSLRRNDFDEDTIQEYDAPLAGIAVPKDTYAYETLDGFEVMGDQSEADVKRRLSALVKELDRVERTNDDVIDDAVLDQLEDLGYA